MTRHRSQFNLSNFSSAQVLQKVVEDVNSAPIESGDLRHPNYKFLVEQTK